MKPIKSVALIALSLAALTACDRRSQNDSINTGAGTGYSGTESSRDVQREEASRSELDRNAAGAAGAAERTDYSNDGTAVGSGSMNSDSEDTEAASGAAGADIYDETATGSGGTSDEDVNEEEWKDAEMGEEDLNIQEEEYTGDTTDSSFEQESGNVKYLDNTSSEPDLRRQDKGIPIGREPGYIDNTSSEGNPNQL